MEEKSLQKFTDLKNLLAIKKLTNDDIKQCNGKILKQLHTHLLEILNSDDGEEKDKLLKKLDDVLPSDTKNQLWQHNHTGIINSIHKLIQEYNRMPKVHEIAVEVKLSRQTVTKHLKEFCTKEIFQTEIDKYHLMLYSLMDKLYIDGVQYKNVKAIRLYFEILTYKTKSLGSHTTNNYVQINNTKIDNLTLQNLPDEAKKAIVNIINDSSKKKVKE